ncbi:EAL domain-containing protein [Dechloromonas sp. ZS-1]|uniref:EAL domain-containing protein n=1 Tax=Dechloromonas sp. ZS-1 TaxID=3138067 RepID=UPI0031FC1B41
MNTPLPNQQIAAALERCAAEVIHRPGTIQPHGCLLAIDEQLIVRHASENVEGLLGLPCKNLLGFPIADFLGEALVVRLSQLFEKQESGKAVTLQTTIQTNHVPRSFNGQAHFHDGIVLIELEPAQVDGASYQALFDHLFIPVRDRLWELEAENGIEVYLNGVAEQIGRLTGIDRVMVYRFDSQWDGEVIAEYCQKPVESFLGHHFPASDIPPQARDLYLKNRLRLISDVEAENTPIFPAVNLETGLPLDLSYAALRSFSPVHLEYLRNMGVSASFSISLITHGRLWGLIACHHYSPFRLTPHIRELADFVGRSASLKITDLEQGELETRVRDAETVVDQLSQSLVQGTAADGAGEAILQLLGATGVIICINQHKFHIGKTPDLAFINHLVNWLRTRSSGIFATEALPESFALASTCNGIANGLLAIQANADYTNYILWFRSEITQLIRWAGNPEKLIETTDAGVRISPRKSFGAWLQSYRGRAAKWSFGDIDLGQRIAMALLRQIADRYFHSEQTLSTRDMLLLDAQTIVGRFNERFAYDYVSNNTLGLLGFQSKELVSHHLVDFIFEEDIPRVMHYLLQVHTGNSDTANVSFRHCRKDGCYLWLELEAKLSSPRNGKTLEFRAKDVTERKKYSAGMEELHRRYHRTLDIKREGILVLDANHRILHSSPSAAELLGYEADALRGLDYCAQLCGAEHCPSTQSPGRDPRCKVSDIAINQQSMQFRNACGATVGVDVYAIPLLNALPAEPNQVVIFRCQSSDQTEFAPLEDVAKCIGIMVTDRHGQIQSVNDGFTRITGYQPAEAIGRSPSMLRSNVHSHDYYQQFWQSLADQKRWRGELWNRRKNGEIYPQFSHVAAVQNVSGEVRNYIAVFQDISTSTQSGERVHALPEHDALTGLPTRILFERIVSNALASKDLLSTFAIAFIDLDHFAEINDALGHITGDRLLYLVANRLSSTLRVDDRIGRWSGDKFVVYLPGVANQSDARSVMQRHLSSLTEPFSVSGQSVRLQARAGISLYPRDGTDVDTLMGAADLAQSHAKKSGPGTIALYEAGLAAASADRFNLAAELRHAIQAQQLSVAYQPQVDVVTGRAIGLEALARWKHPDRGFVSPAEFIQVAEECHLIEGLGAEIFRMVCAQISTWRAEGAFALTVGVNVSPAQLKPGLAQSMAAILRQYQIPPELIEIEITESALQPTPEIRAIVNEIKQLGVNLAIDDFGTGYSSLSHLKLFPFDRIKIDKSFVDGLPNNADDRAIAQTIIALAKALNVEALAEGVETAEQADCLRQDGAHTIQGYFYSKPLTPDALAEYLRA